MPRRGPKFRSEPFDKERPSRPAWLTALIVAGGFFVFTVADVLKFGFGGTLFWLLFVGLVLSLLVAGVLAAVSSGRSRI